jgi:hypothetical protein
MSLQLKLTPMKTNEENRNKSDRNIILNMFDMFYEFFGNMSGNIRSYYIKDDTIYFYNNDNGFTHEDKVAIKIKNQSGNIVNTAGHNGFGIALVLDRLLPDKSVATIYSLNDKHLLQYGHFECSEWTNYKKMDEEHKLVMKKMGVDVNNGSFFAVPLREEHKETINKIDNKLRLACVKFNNIKISNNEIDLFWNGEKQIVERRITPLEDAISLNYQIGHLKKNKNSETTRLTLYLKILNYSEMDNFFQMKVQNEYIAITNIDSSYFNNKNLTVANEKIKDFLNNGYNFYPIENGKLNLNIVREDLPQQENDMSKPWIDGCSVVIKNHIVNLIAIKKCLKIENSTDFSEYNGRPRIENHIDKNSSQYQLPVDKSHIKPTTYGEWVLSFSRVILQTIKKKKNDKNNKQEHVNKQEHANEQELVSKQEHVNNIQNAVVGSSFPQKEILQKEKSNYNEYQERRSDFSNSQKTKLARELTQYWQMQPDKTTRCPCCQRILLPGSTSHAGHIRSCFDGGSNEIQNGLLICQKCNSNDTRHMYKMMTDDWGDDHKNTIQFKDICEKLNKKYRFD